MDVTATDLLLGDFMWVGENLADTQNDKTTLKDRVELARRRWMAESGFKNVFVTTVVMLPYRLQDVYSGLGSVRLWTLLVWYFALGVYFLRRRWLLGRQVTTRKIIEGIFMGSKGDDADTMWLTALQIIWVSTGQFWYLSMEGATFVAPTLMFTAVHVPREAFYYILVPLNAMVTFCQQYFKSGTPLEVAVCHCVLQAVAVSFIITMREEAQKKHYHNRLDSERGRIDSMREKLWAEAQRATFRGMLDTVFDASCICNHEGRILSSTPQLDAFLLAAGSNASGLVGKNFADFANGAGEEERATSFLRQVSQCTTARRIHTSLKRHTGTSIEVTVSGITVPTDEASASDAGQRQLFIGLALDSGAAALEAEEPAWEEAFAAAPHAIPEQRDAKAQDLQSADGTAAVGVAKSVCSAPPLLQFNSVAREQPDESVCTKGDCLPASTLVRVEGKAAAMRVDAINLGQRVLCMDHITGALKYAEVVEVDVSEQAGPDIVEVELEDGTKLQMTADHPVFADSTKHMSAKDLQPGVNNLDVLKVVSLPVKAVREVPKEASSTRLVNLSVHQPQRHSLFVAASADEAVGSVAVASASLTSPEERVPLELRLKNTFIHIEEEAMPSRTRRRSSSLPGRYVTSGKPPAALEANEPIHKLSAKRPCVMTSRASSGSCRSSSVGSMPISSLISEPSKDDEMSIVLSKGVEDRRIRGWTAMDHARLSDVFKVRRAGLKSMGSIGHEDGWCYPCLMNNWNNRDRPCIFGVGCSRCHEDHNKRQVKQARHSRPRGPRIAELPQPNAAGRVA